MEAMRIALEKDRQVDGHLTSYSQSLERSVLKKDKFLNEPAKQAAPPQSKPQQGPARQPNVSVFGERLQQALRKD